MPSLDRFKGISGQRSIRKQKLLVVTHWTVLYCSVLYCTVLYCTVLYCTVLLRTKVVIWDNYIDSFKGHHLILEATDLDNLVIN